MVAINLSGAWPYQPDTDPRIKDIALMKRYAAEQLRRADEHNRDFNIALELIQDPGVATIAAQIWNNDPVVLQERIRMQEEHGERAELPTKETILKEVLGMARNRGFTANERYAGYKLYAEMAGYTGRAAGAMPGVTVFANKVMYVKDHGDDNSWESRATQQQQALVQAARDDAKRNETRH
jgi:hypothetical protein